MIVIPGAGTPNRAERQAVDALRPHHGVVATTVLLPGRRTIEVDLLHLSDRGITTIEAKGTRQSGTLVAHANAPWTIGGQSADFPSGPNPTVQARTQAQVAAGILREAGITVPRIKAVIVIAGDVTIPGGYEVVTNDVAVTTPAHLAATLVAMTSVTPGLVQSNAAGALEALGIPAHLIPTARDLDAEGFPTRELNPYGPGAPTEQRAPKPAPYAAGPQTHHPTSGRHAGTNSAGLSRGKLAALAALAIALIAVPTGYVIFRDLAAPSAPLTNADAAAHAVFSTCRATPPKARPAGPSDHPYAETTVPCPPSDLTPEQASRSMRDAGYSAKLVTLPSTTWAVTGTDKAGREYVVARSQDAKTVVLRLAGRPGTPLTS